jgi:hypothetical protein
VLSKTTILTWVKDGDFLFVSYFLSHVGLLRHEMLLFQCYCAIPVVQSSTAQNARFIVRDMLFLAGNLKNLMSCSPSFLKDAQKQTRTANTQEADTDTNRTATDPDTHDTRHA